MITKDEFKELRDIVFNQAAELSKLKDRIVKLESLSDETSTGVYYDHLPEEYTSYIDEGLAEKRRGE